jgi:hypothetical protein
VYPTIEVLLRQRYPKSMVPGTDTGLEKVGAKISSDPSCGPAIVDKHLDLAFCRIAIDSPTNDFGVAQALEIPLDGQLTLATRNLGIAWRRSRVHLPMLCGRAVTRLGFRVFSGVSGGIFATHVERGVTIHVYLFVLWPS